MEKEEKEVSTCGYGDVHDTSEWDKFNGFLTNPEKSFLPPEEREESSKITIQKVAARGRRIRINVSKRTGFTDAELKRHISACKLLEVVLNSAEFKKRVIAKKFTTTKLTSTQVYDKLMTGEEDLQKGVDYEWDVEVEMYTEKSNVVGYTYPTVIWTRINRYVTADYDEAGIAGNLTHEWCHKAGFGHASASDHTSVPYAVGYLVRDMINEYKKGARWVDLYPDVIKTPAPKVTPLLDTGVAVAEPAPAVVTPLPTPEPKKVCIRPWYFFGLKEVCHYE